MKMRSKLQRLVAELKRRIWGPMGSIALHSIAIVALLNLTMGDSSSRWTPTPPFEMPTKADPIDTPPVPPVTPDVVTPPPEVPEIPELPDVVNYDPDGSDDATAETPQDGRGSGEGSSATGTGSGDSDGKTLAFDLSSVLGPLILDGLYKDRMGPGRERTRGRPDGHTAITEGAVIKALRWLKKEQKPDGSWDTPPVAMTGLALLCYLAHGELPGSEEFGATVEKAIKYLETTQSTWPKRYEWAIATFALSEAYGMTRIPSLKDAAYKGVDVIIRGQRPSGGWCYNLTPQDEANDTSVMGWCIQALKAAQLAGIRHDGMDSAMQNAIKALQANANPSGGFGYRAPGEGGLTGVGVLSMQLLGAANQPEARNGLAWLDRATCDWDDAWLGAPLYYWYYVTQAKFHAGGSTWKGWNRQFAPELVKNQTVLKTAGANGKDIGYWGLPLKNGQAVKDHSTGLVYNTTLCCLMLEVYYKVLPTYQPPKQLDPQDQVPANPIGVTIDISMPAAKTPASPAG